jgi:hypothetical protein
VLCLDVLMIVLDMTIVNVAIRGIDVVIITAIDDAELVMFDMLQAGGG